jgi:CRISPR/Cas system-associated exonuclease Cas4 (RecB family)
MLKNLVTRYEWAGKAVHAAIKSALSDFKRRGDLDIEPIIERTRARMRSEFDASRRHSYRRAPKIVGLVEHEMDQYVPDEQWTQVWKKVENCLRNFPNSQVIVDSIDTEWLSIDEMDSFEHEGVKIYASPDFAYRTKDATVIVDWKTGRERTSDSAQLVAYALFARAKWGATNVEAYDFYLNDGRSRSVDIDSELEGWLSMFRESSAKLLALHEASQFEFPKCSGRARCSSCVFQSLCSEDE